MLVTKYSDWVSYVIIRVFLLFPVGLYMIVLFGMMFSGFHFGKSIQAFVDEKKINEDPLDFWADVRGIFRTSLLLVDYSGVFTGILIFATTKLRAGSAPMQALYLVPMITIVPMLLTIIRAGCEGHIADKQPAYAIYSSTEETITFDLLPVCFASSHFGPLWSVLFFTAQLLYNCVGPMVIYLVFIYSTFVEQMPTVQTVPNLFYGLLCITFSIPSILLYMPYGTKIVALVRYTSQSCIVSILCYIVLYFVYGWQNIETDIHSTTNFGSSGKRNIFDYLTSPISPIYTILLFTLVPALLMSKFVAVFDLLLSGNDVVKHISAASQFIPGPDVFGLIIGYLIMFSPLLIVTGFASYTLFNLIVKHKLSLSDAFQPSSDWMAHSSVNTVRPRPYSLAYGFFNSFIRISYPTALFLLLVAEAFLGALLSCIFMLNGLSLIGFNGSTIASNYRSVMLLAFLILHTISIFEISRAQREGNHPERLSLYIGVATMEMATLNGYMWMYSSDHPFIDWDPIFLILFNTVLRGLFICTAIAIRANMIELNRPQRIRDANDIYDIDAHPEADMEDESPIIFDLARA
ncbi:hypothetical protein WR25_00674 isoform B [Diploscapter pachys]|nr:hypothetical protein WR25_00674 isoform B [Diploscapter pachys]